MISAPRSWIIRLFALASLSCGAVAADSSAARLVKEPGVRQGVVVVLGCDDAALLSALADKGRNLVLGLNADAKRVDAIRSAVRATGGYGPVSVDCHASSSIPLAENEANLIVAADFQALEKDGLKIGELTRILAPYGVAFLKNAAMTTIDGCKVSQTGEWTRVDKLYPAEMDEWQQYSHDTSGMMMSADKAVGPSSSLRWVSGGYWNDSMSDPVETVSANGRVFYSNTTAAAPWPPGTAEGRSGYLEARDAFNGQPLWRRKITPGDYRPIQTRVIAVGDYVYTSLPEAHECVGQLDAATGEVLKTYQFPMADTHLVGDMFLTDGGTKAWSVKTGEKLWEVKIDKLIANPFRNPAINYFVADTDNICYVAGTAAGTVLHCYALKTGAKQWEVPLQSPGEGLRFCAFGRILTEEAIGQQTKYGVPIPGVVRAYSVKDGKLLWKYDIGVLQLEKTGVRSFQSDADAIWCHTYRVPEGEHRAVGFFICLDPNTGLEKKAVRSVLENGRCHPHRATSNYLFGPDGSMFGLGDGKSYRASEALRGSCQFGYIPANGLLYQGLNKCLCTNSVRGYAAFAPMPPTETTPPAGDQRLEKGPAFGVAAAAAPAAAGDWPAFRHDSQRSGCSAVTLPAALVQVWKTEVPGKLSSPVLANGTVFVAATDEHTVYALDAADGKMRWSYSTGGRVDSPPTCVAGRIFVGSRDGWVYCLNQADGKLVWRYRVAPVDRRILVRGQLESVWPAHGAVLVEDGIAYAAAGRHTDTDGGLFVTALKAETGEVVWTTPNARSSPCAFNDVLVANGPELYCDQMDIDRATGKVLQKNQAQHAQTKGLSGGPLGMLNEEVLEPPYTESGGRRQWRYFGYDGHLLAVDGERVFGAVYEGTAFYPEHTWKEGYRGWGAGEKGKLTLKGNKIFGVVPPATPWSQNFPGGKFRIKALINAGDKVVAAVAPDNADEAHGEIRFYAASDGKPAGEIKFDVAPAFDGVIAADGALYVSGVRGAIICLRAAKP